MIRRSLGAAATAAALWLAAGAAQAQQLSLIHI